jgi:hypothetical protein
MVIFPMTQAETYRQDLKNFLLQVFGLMARGREVFLIGKIGKTQTTQIKESFKLACDFALSASQLSVNFPMQIGPIILILIALCITALKEPADLT